MTKSGRALLAASFLLAPVLSAAAPDKAGCSDPALFPVRMPKYRIETCEKKDFGTYAFRTAKAGKKENVEGAFTFVTYAVSDRKDDASGLEVVRNYEAAVKSIGGAVVASDPERWLTAKVVQGGAEAWAEVEKGNGKIWLRIVEKKGMEQHVVADAAAFGNDLRATGHAAVYGIYFDTGKAVVKPESQPALAEVAKLLAADPSLKLWVVGHTDSVGGLDANMKLSQARAEAVAAALVSGHGVAAARLKGQGVGPLAPVASNDSEDGRAKNRRVELVKQ